MWTFKRERVSVEGNDETQAQDNVFPIINDTNQNKSELNFPNFKFQPHHPVRLFTNRAIEIPPKSQIVLNGPICCPPETDLSRVSLHVDEEFCQKV